MSGGKEAVNVPVHIPKVQLWWSWELELERLNLYVVETPIFDETGIMSDRKEKIKECKNE